jgi:hypothetical protein
LASPVNRGISCLSGDSLDGPITCSGWGSGAHGRRAAPVGKCRLAEKSLNTLLGFETTGPRLECMPVGVCGGVGPIGFGWCCCCPAWWWGVVFDSWIVVASIKLAYVMDLVLFVGVGF